jgi:hypothetical protein
MPAFGETPVIIERAKLTDYLLSHSHEQGRSKARVFASAGYTAANWRRLRGDLLAALRTSAPATPEATPYGVKYVVQVALEGPTGRRLHLTTIWIAGPTGWFPRLVTAYPRSRTW